MDVCKCIVPLRHGCTLNSRQATSTLVWLVEGCGRSLTTPGVLPQNWGGNEPNCSVTCMVLKATANDRRHLALSWASVWPSPISKSIVAAVAEWPKKVSDRGWLVTSSSPVPLKTRCVGERCMLNLSSAQTFSRWCGEVVRRGVCRLRCRLCHLTMDQNYEVRCQNPGVA
ncbi:uncharacterized protein TNCV_4517091 [Trichonephila clavipes]|nr:uncharacterized protein TNCV_4517091 [Trichonephila clavipes]